jgi:6-phosphogluconolactonase
MEQRHFLAAGLACWFFLAVISVRAADQGKYLVYIGTYTEHGSKGIYVCEFDSATGRLGSPRLAAETVQPSFLAMTRDRQFLYAANETNQFNGAATGGLSAFAVDAASGKLTMLNQVSSRGGGPAFITLDRSGRYLLAANYDGGNVAAFRLLDDGKVGESTGFAQHQGTGPNKERQEMPHAHAIVMSPDNRYALVPDLGIDEVLVYPFEASSGELGPARVVKTKAGAGPRHLIFSGDGKMVYVINELDSTITLYSYDSVDSGMNPIQTVSTLAAGYAGANTAGELALDAQGKFLYATNRGDENSIAVFTVNPADGKLALIERVPTEGKTPRHFAIDPTGQWLAVVNQDSDTVMTFRIDAKSGRLKKAGQPVRINSPAMVDFMVRGGSK